MNQYHPGLVDAILAERRAAARARTVGRTPVDHVHERRRRRRRRPWSRHV